MDYRESELAQYWDKKACIVNAKPLSRPGYVKVAELRHEATNYDELLNSPEFKALDESDREVAYWIIKSACSTLVQQQRARVREQKIQRIEQGYRQSKDELNELLKGRQQDRSLIQRLMAALNLGNSRIQQLEQENALALKQIESQKLSLEILEERNISFQEELERKIAESEASKALSYQMRGRVGGLTASNNRKQRRIVELESRVKELEAYVKELESRHSS